MRISPIAQYSVQSNKIQNQKSNNTSFKSGYSLVNTPYGSSCPLEVSQQHWLQEHGTPLPPLEYFVKQNLQNGTAYGQSGHTQDNRTPNINHGNFSFPNIQTTSLNEIANKLHNVSDGEIRDFLFDATVEEPREDNKSAHKHISYYFKDMIKSEGDKWTIKGLLDRAISGPAWAENGEQVDANSAYLIYWFKDCLPESTKKDYENKSNELIKKVWDNTKDKSWWPHGIATDSDRVYSGPKYPFSREEVRRDFPVHFHPYGNGEDIVKQCMENYGVTREEARAAVDQAAHDYMFGSPALSAEGIRLNSDEIKSMDNIISELEKIPVEKQRSFLIRAQEKQYIKGEGTVYRHIAHAMRNASTSNETRERFKNILDNALGTISRFEQPDKVMANSAYILEWFAPCLPEYTLEGYEYMQRDLVKQARIDLNNPEWHPYVEPYDPHISGSGARYN